MSRVATSKLALRLFRPESVARHAPPTRRSVVRDVFGEVTRDDLLFAGLPCVLLTACLACFLILDADVPVSELFYVADSGAWPLAKTEPFATLYRSGCVPAVCLGVAGLAAGLAASLFPRLRPARRYGLFLALALALGPGVVVNGILKPSVARPRPCQTVTFGGECQFAYFGAHAAQIAAKSFPSGHASMGFFFMTPALLVYRHRPRLATSILLGGFAYGLLMGVARIAQGAHFATDVIGAALCVYAVAVSVLVARRGVKRYLARRSRSPREPGPDRPHVLAMPRSGGGRVSERHAA